ncbi:MAG: F0F1 ATP synthase subunit delta [Candidatus Omnitrophica bacterium]|nr:F0F1 ATP synthase subunit delta [Candidatus Omnitrophota bacterium]
MLIFSLIILQLIIFSSLIFILKKMITRNVISATQHLDELNRQYLKKEQQIEERLKQIEDQTKSVISQAQEKAERLKVQIIQEAEVQRDKMIEEARTQSKEIIEQAEKTRQALIAEIEERIDKEAIQKACDLIRDTLPEEFKEAVHNRWLEELLFGGFEGFDTLNISEDIKEVEVISAFPLTENYRKNITKKLKDILKRDVELKEKVDPALVAGVIINIGSLILDGSLQFKIKENARRLRTTRKDGSRL